MTQDEQIRELQGKIDRLNTQLDSHKSAVRALNEIAEKRGQAVASADAARRHAQAVGSELVNEKRALRDLLATINAELLARYDGAPDSPTRWMGDLIQDIEAATSGVTKSVVKDSLPPEAVWPNVIAPAMYENPAPGWEDPRVPDLAKIRQLARQVGYSISLHGSLKRDVDLIAAPWTDRAVVNADLVEHLCGGLQAARVGGIEHKPHGRSAVTLQLPGWYKPIDLSIFPLLRSETIASVTEWANTTFGKATIEAQIDRAWKEFRELLQLRGLDTEKVAEEAADVCICLYRVIGTLDPEAINKKMKKNRARKWQVDGNGTAQHVGE